MAPLNRTPLFDRSPEACKFWNGQIRQWTEATAGHSLGTVARLDVEEQRQELRNHLEAERDVALRAGQGEAAAIFQQKIDELAAAQKAADQPRDPESGQFTAAGVSGFGGGTRRPVTPPQSMNDVFRGMLEATRLRPTATEGTD